MNRNNLMVSIIILTYKHEKFIKQAIEGVLMQETDFEFELIIADDCSPENTSKIVNEIIKNHSKGFKIYYFRHEKNIGVKENGLFALTKCKSKYIALCEGDDYWTDPLKLQKQVDFLEKNDDYGLVHTNFDTLKNRQVKKSVKKKHSVPVGDVKEQLIYENFIGTLTVCARRSVFMDSISITQKLALYGDLAIWTVLSNLSKIGYINDSTAVYRITEESASNSLDPLKQFNFVKSAFLTKFILIKKFNYNARTIKLVNKRYIKILFKHSLILEDNEVINEFLFHCKNNNNFTGIIYRFFYKLSRFTLIKNTLLKIVKN